MSSSAKGRVFWPGPKLQQLNTENFESRILQYLVSTLQWGLSCSFHSRVYGWRLQLSRNLQPHKGLPLNSDWMKWRILVKHYCFSMLSWQEQCFLKCAGDRRCVCNKLWDFCLKGAMLYKSYKSLRYPKRCKDFVKIAFCYSCSACHVLWSLTVYNVNDFFKTCSYSFIISYWYVWYVCVANSPERMNSHASDGLWLGAMFDATARTSSMAIFWNVHKWQPKAGRQAGRHGY